ncbi:MAG: type II toxin-antitoxin system PemK/MazF family toxin [Clostridiales bacterium]|nr:type II toxin-antitoxin system PemK/MazF family toxin [Clostridiales bacterium]
MSEMESFPYNKFTYRKMSINSGLLETPRNTYQREFRPKRAERIAATFDERIANEPKVSLRDGHYYVFDGQHTIAARKHMNNDEDLPILCKVFTGMTAAEEALLFAQQTGASVPLTPGEKIRALVYAGDQEAVNFQNATEDVGLLLDYSQAKGECRIGCIGTAFREYRRVGQEIYKEALSHIVDAWDGDPHSLRSEVIQGVIRFVELYHGEYRTERLVSQLRHTDPLTIYREGQAMGNTLGVEKKYLYQVFRIYNGTSKKNALPMKF